MRTIATDQNNDIAFSKGNVQIASGLDAVIYCCEHAVKAQLGEMILALDKGVPNFQTIWQDAANIVQFEAYVRRAIMSVENVTGVLSLTTEVQRNTVVYRAEIQTIFGNGILSNGL